ncbi:MAG: hypothetical protein GXP45_05610 [bacterium]|nr:hypothetical protein [bacterium]
MNIRLPLQNLDNASLIISIAMLIITIFLLVLFRKKDLL